MAEPARPLDDAANSQPDTTQVAGLTRTGLLTGGVFLSAAAVLTGGRVASADAATAQTRSGRLLEFEVALDPSSFDFVRTPARGRLATGPVFVRGSIFPNGSLDRRGIPKAGAKAVGTHLACGWIFAPASAIAFEAWELAGRGTIQTQGVATKTPTRAVTGGTGEFRGARGEITAEILVASAKPLRFVFRSRFELI